MNILYLCADRGIPIRGHKGAAVHVREMCRAFSQAGHTVTLLTPRPGPADGPAVAATLLTVPLPALPHSSQEQQARAYTKELFAFARRLVDQQPFDFIYERYSLWSDVGAQLSRATGLPLVLEVNAPLRAEAARYRRLDNPAIAAAVEQAQFSTAHTVCVVSEKLRDYVAAHGGQASRLLVLPNGVDPTHFHPAVRGGGMRQRYGLHGKRVVGFAGRVRPWHDIETLLDAFAQLAAANPAYHLLLVGQTPPELPQRLHDLGLAAAVTLTGPVPHHEVPAHLAAMDVAVSSHARLDEFYFSPLKLFEYLACATPTVAADIGQPAQIIQPGVTGLLYPPGDAAALARQIERLAADREAARQMAWRGAAQVLRRHTWAHNAQAVAARVTRLTPTAVSHPDAPPLPILDEKLHKRLYRATRADLARPLLKKLPEFNGRRALRLKQIDDIRVLKYKPLRRCVLGYELKCRAQEDGRAVPVRVIGKVFKDDRGRRLLALQQQLWQHGFGPAAVDRITVPAGLGYAPKMQMLVQEWSPGQTLDQLAADGPVTDLMPRAAQALAKLHATCAFNKTPDLLRTYSLENELDGLDDYTQNLAMTRPAALAQVTALRDGLRRWAQTLPPAPRQAPLHRDFYYSQILFHGDDLILIDFDLMAWGDAAVDVANFSAHMHLLGADLGLGGLDALAADAALFKQAYADARPVDETFWQRVAFYEAATYFRLLNVVATRPHMAHLFADLLARTETLLLPLEATV